MQERAARKDAHDRRAREGEREQLLSQLQVKHQEEAHTADAHIRAAERQVKTACILDRIHMPSGAPSTASCMATGSGRPPVPPSLDITSQICTWPGNHFS